MYLLYLDDAGSVGNAEERHFILAGIAVFERQVYFLQRELENVVARTNANEPARVELHANAMQNRRNFWRSFSRRQCRALIRHGLACARSLQGHWATFGAVVDKAAVSAEDPVEYAFEQVCSRFDKFLQRKYKAGNTQRGLLIIDNSAKATRLQTLATEFRQIGHRWGSLRNFIDVPMFVDSKATRSIQYADLVAYALYRRFEKTDPEFFDVIADTFDREGGIVHGLWHLKRDVDDCDCPYCAPSLLDLNKT
jgi:hypothetical protein